MALMNVDVRRMSAAMLSSITLVTLISAGAAGARPSTTDKSISKAGALVLADFPSGWASSAQSSSGSSDALAKTIPSCRQYVAARQLARKSAARTESNNFKKSEESYSNTVVVMPTAAASTKLSAAYTGTKSQACLQQLSQKAVTASVAQSSPRLQNPKVTADLSEVSGPTVGDSTVRYRLEVGVTGSNLPIAQKVYFDEVFVQNGRSQTSYEYSTQFELPDNHFLDQLIDASQRRLTAALGGQPPPDPSKPAPLGTAQTAGDGAVVTIFSMTPGVPGKYNFGGPFTVVDAQICAQKGASSTLNANSYPIRLVYADNTSATETFGGPDPQFNSGNLSDGACTRGNVSFDQGSGAALTQVVYDPGSSDGKPLAWAAS
jgi:hypothetical protein